MAHSPFPFSLPSQEHSLKLCDKVHFCNPDHTAHRCATSEQHRLLIRPHTLSFICNFTFDDIRL